ncbi:hypothetical protein PIB30_026337 [Stylosanthes scabra]|uniref:Uncharacterized protein n=1 Tax=Stylosanthes scabra TaxID=79078 RepID=A0ABU6Y922_9FABA|nr:hypothetical protein [Stylosanthes scabra]
MDEEPPSRTPTAQPDTTDCFLRQHVRCPPSLQPCLTPQNQTLRIRYLLCTGTGIKKTGFGGSHTYDGAGSRYLDQATRSAAVCKVPEQTQACGGLPRTKTTVTFSMLLPWIAPLITLCLRNHRLLVSVSFICGRCLWWFGWPPSKTFFLAPVGFKTRTVAHLLPRASRVQDQNRRASAAVRSAPSQVALLGSVAVVQGSLSSRRLSLWFSRHYQRPPLFAPVFGNLSGRSSTDKLCLSSSADKLVGGCWHVSKKKR